MSDVPTCDECGAVLKDPDVADAHERLEGHTTGIDFSGP